MKFAGERILISFDHHKLTSFEDGEVVEVPGIGIILRTIPVGFYIIVYCWRHWFKFRMRFRTKAYMDSLKQRITNAISTLEIDK